MRDRIQEKIVFVMYANFHFMLILSMATKRNVVIEKLRRPYYLIRNDTYIYKNFVNRKYRVTKSDLREISPVQGKIIAELNQNGIATVPFEELFPIAKFLKLSEWVSENEVKLKQKSKKKFLYSYYGTEDSNKPLDLNNPFVQLYLSEELLQIVVAYLGYIPQIHEVYIEKTVPVKDVSPTYSQNWHRDPEEKKTLKIFLYLNDVNIESGPFTYILGSQPSSKSRLSKIFPQKLPHGSYPEEGSVSSLIDNESCYVATARKATLIFCDTSGLHRGGLATKYDRIMSTAFFPSKKYSEKPLFNLNSLKGSDIAKYNLNFLAQKVLGLK